MNRKTKISLIFGVIIVVFLIISWWILRGQHGGQSPIEQPIKPTAEYQLLIQQSTWIYDLQNPERKAKHVSIAPEGITEKYLPVWKKLFMEKNNISEDYFDKHIKVLETGISTDQSRQLSPASRGREYFEILYYIKIDWIELNNADHLVIRKKDQQEYLSIDEFIAEEKNAEETFQQVGRFIPIEKAPISFEEAVEKLQQINSDAKYLKPVYLTLGFKSPSYDKEQIANGGVLLYGEGTIDFKKNQCVEGYFNLVTEKGSTMRTLCWYE
jgi:hypothetical protein